MSSTKKAIGRLILVRHGQSLWNVTTETTSARFTGWANIGLTKRGRLQAHAAGRAISQYLNTTTTDDNIRLTATTIDCTLCSLLERAQTTLKLLLQSLEKEKKEESSSDSINTMISTWRLNERHYGALVGLSKVDAETKYDELSSYRHGWDTRPPPMDPSQRMEWSYESHCQTATYVNNNTHNSSSHNIKMMEKVILKDDDDDEIMRGKRNRRIPLLIPASESLKDTYERVLVLWKMVMVPRIKGGETLLVVAHANTIKAMLHFLEPNLITEQSFNQLKVPSATPLLYQFEEGNDNDGESIIPGGLSIIQPTTKSSHKNMNADELRYQLNGQWLNTQETEGTQFCSEDGQDKLEHEIA